MTGWVRVWRLTEGEVAVAALPALVAAAPHNASATVSVIVSGTLMEQHAAVGGSIGAA